VQDKWGVLEGEVEEVSDDWEGFRSGGEWRSPGLVLALDQNQTEESEQSKATKEHFLRCGECCPVFILKASGEQMDLRSS
jgi:hypothetical protein